MNRCDWCVGPLTIDDVGTVCEGCREFDRAQRESDDERYEDYWSGDGDA